MATDPMVPAVWSDPQVQFFLMGRAESLGVLDRKFALEGFDFPLELADVFFQCVHTRVLGCQPV